MIISQLRTSIIMRKGNYCIYIYLPGLPAERISQSVNNPVDTSDRRNHPYFIPDTDLTGFTTIPHKRKIPVRNIQFRQLRRIRILQYPLQIRFDIPFIDPSTFSDCTTSMPDSISVFNNILVLGKIFKCYFMTGRNIFL